MLLALTAACATPTDDVTYPVTSHEPPETAIATECAEVGADIAYAGVVVTSLDSCQISAVPLDETLDEYIANLSLVGLDHASRYTCVGEDDGLTYDHVVRSRDVVVDAWTQVDAIFDADGYMEWESESHRGMHCSGDDDSDCYSCCPCYCCSGVPTSGIGSGRPHDLVQCVRTGEWSAY